MKRNLIMLLLILAAGLLTACGLPTAGAAGETPMPVEPDGGPGNSETPMPVEPDGGPGGKTPRADDLRPIPIEDVQVEVGVGSPIPVHVNVAGTWPDLCAQLAEVHQTFTDDYIAISLLATPADPGCPPDHLGLPFALAIPINIVEMPEGSYTVDVNGVRATLDVPVTPPADGGEEPPPIESGDLCPEIVRPAIMLSIPNEGFEVVNPLDGAACPTPLDGSMPGPVQAAADGVYFRAYVDGSYVLKRIEPDGTASLLPFTSVSEQDTNFYHSFTVSADGSLVAWSAASAGPNYEVQPTSTMWVANVADGDPITPLLPLTSDDMPARAMAPVRFSEDNTMLYYTLQPVGIGGAWSSFVGRYDNLYALRLNSDAPPERVFDCADYGLFMCIGDFYEVSGQISALAYVEQEAVVVLNGEGEPINTLAVEADYLGFPTFGPGGELVFYAADLSDEALLPVEGILYRVAPPTAPAEVLARDPGLMMPHAWLDATHVVTGYAMDEGSWGTAVVGLDGSMQVVDPHGSFVDTLPAP